MKTEAVGDDGHYIKCRGYIVAEEQVVGQPQEGCADDHELHFDVAGGIHAPGEKDGGDDGQPADPAGADGAQGKQRLQGDEEDLQSHGVAELQKGKIPDDGNKVADKSTDAAKNQIAQTDEGALDRLCDQNLFLFLQKADAHHDQTTDHGNGIADEKRIHIMPFLIKRVQLVFCFCAERKLTQHKGEICCNQIYKRYAEQEHGREENVPLTVGQREHLVNKNLDGKMYRESSQRMIPIPENDGFQEILVFQEMVKKFYQDGNGQNSAESGAEGVSVMAVMIDEHHTF